MASETAIRTSAPTTPLLLDAEPTLRPIPATPRSDLEATMPPVTIRRICADARDIPLPDSSVDLVVTSPPY